MYDQTKFPFKFQSWLSSNEGGVRKPMDQDSGRPLGDQIIETKIHDLIRSMVKDYVSNPRRTLCVLVGGPGNGKTDLMEFASECFFDEIQYEKELGRKDLKAKFEKNNRKAKFEHGNYSLQLTQDASQRDDNSESYIDALAKDLEDLSEANNGLALICINRGILESLRNEARIAGTQINEYKECVGLIYELNSISAIIQNKVVWGNTSLNDFAIYTWSMDYDSLFEESEINLIQKIVDQSDCIRQYTTSTHDLHPAKLSLNFLDSETNNDHFSKILRRYEVLNGKRFTYREIFSLFAYLFSISKREETEIEEILVAYDKLNSDDSINQFIQLYKLYQFTPNFKFFNNFLSSTETHIEDSLGAFMESDKKELRKFLNSLAIKNQRLFASVPQFISSGEITYFDPINYEQNGFNITDMNGITYSLKQLTDRVIYNSKLDFEVFANVFSEIDIKLIQCVEKIKNDYCLEKDYDSLNARQLNSLDKFKSYLNSLLIAFIKRGLFFSKFFIRDKELIENFMKLTQPENSVEFIEDFYRSVSKNREIENSLSTSIGQTAGQVKHNVFSRAPMHYLMPVEQRGQKLPSNDQIFFRYKENDKWNYIIITYKIYRNIILNSENIFSACLDRNYHLWKGLKKIELTNKESSFDKSVVIEDIGTVKHNRSKGYFELIHNNK